MKFQQALVKNISRERRTIMFEELLESSEIKKGLAAVALVQATTTGVLIAILLLFRALAPLFR
jgi:hypothetical protein